MSRAGPKAGINQGRATFTTKGIDGLRAREMSGAGGMVGKGRCGSSRQRQAKEGEDRCPPAGFLQLLYLADTSHASEKICPYY